LTPSVGVDEPLKFPDVYEGSSTGRDGENGELRWGKWENCPLFLRT